MHAYSHSLHVLKAHHCDLSLGLCVQSQFNYIDCKIHMHLRPRTLSKRKRDQKNELTKRLHSLNILFRTSDGD